MKERELACLITFHLCGNEYDNETEKGLKLFAMLFSIVDQP